MKKSKLLFLILSILFLLILIWIAMDISSRTTFPGHKKPATEKVEKGAGKMINWKAQKAQLQHVQQLLKSLLH